MAAQATATVGRGRATWLEAAPPGAPAPDEAELVVATTWCGPVATVVLRGALSLSTGPVLARRLSRLVLSGRHVERVELDLSALRSLDVAGLHAIVRAAALARGVGCALVVRHPSSCVLGRLALVDPAGRLGRRAHDRARCLRDRGLREQIGA